MFGLRCLLPAVVECFLVRFIAFFRVRAALLSACRRGALFSPFKRFFRVRLFSLRLRLQSGLNRLIRPLCRGAPFRLEFKLRQTIYSVPLQAVYCPGVLFSVRQPAMS